MNYTFAPLPYPADALEPVIDKTTMEIHHGRHHKAYFDNFIAAIQDTPLANETLETIFAGISKHSPAVRRKASCSMPSTPLSAASMPAKPPSKTPASNNSAPAGHG